MSESIALFWFRRDLRLDDNAGLYHALKSGIPVMPIFIFDSLIINDLHDRRDRRVSFIHDQLRYLKHQLNGKGSDLRLEYGEPVAVFRKLLQEFTVTAVYTNHDYEPYARQRDTDISRLLESQGIKLHTFKDQVIFEKNDILKDDGAPYTVYTPYSKKWKAAYPFTHAFNFPSEQLLDGCVKLEPLPLLALEQIGFHYTDPQAASKDIDESIIQAYDQHRDYPYLNGTSRLSVHLRFGTLSIRQLVRMAESLNEKFLNELIWREFYQMILWHFPRVVQDSFKPEYDRIPWRTDEQAFDRWKNGKTGYPIVDAGMRELKQTGYMHNRVRMIVASFLTKHLLMDWRLGEAYFAEILLDYDLASNNGGWQWAAGSGCDAAPYFRIFNPYIQTEKFDPEHRYITHWVPEWQTPEYPQPMVDHAFARDRAIKVYSEALGKPIRT